MFCQPYLYLHDPGQYLYPAVPVSRGRTRPPEPINLDEPDAIALTTRKLNLKHVVITTVTRDDLPDGGAGQFVATINAIHKEELPKATIEVLISDLKGQSEPLVEIMQTKPDIINHNIETVPGLYKAVRPQASYSRSLQILKWIGAGGDGIMSKSGLMLGLGETFKEIVNALYDLRAVNCNIVTLGQYLSPSPTHIPIQRYIHPDEFKKLEEICKSKWDFLPSAQALWCEAHTTQPIPMRAS